MFSIGEDSLQHCPLGSEIAEKVVGTLASPGSAEPAGNYPFEAHSNSSHLQQIVSSIVNSVCEPNGMNHGRTTPDSFWITAANLWKFRGLGKRVQEVHRIR